MWAFFENVQLCRNSCFVQRKIKVDAVLRRHSLVFARREQKRRRRLRSDMQLVRKIFEQFRIGIIAEQILARAAVSIWSLQCDHRVSKDQEIRPAAHATNGIGSAAVSVIEMRACRRCKMTTGRKAHHPDAISCYAEFASAAAYKTNCALRIAKFNGVVIL